MSRRTTTRPNIRHAQAAKELRAQPGVWLPVGEYATWHGAWVAAEQIRTAHSKPMYEPAGAFQTRTKLTEMGALVEARYMPSDDEAWADALASLGDSS